MSVGQCLRQGLSERRRALPRLQKRTARYSDTRWFNLSCFSLKLSGLAGDPGSDCHGDSLEDLSHTHVICPLRDHLVISAEIMTKLLTGALFLSAVLSSGLCHSVEREKSTEDTKPGPKVGIVGAGVGGAISAFFLRRLLGPTAEIFV